MGKIQFFAINFNTERQVFYPGEQLAGNVVLVLTEPMEARAIKMEFEGKSYCHWYEEEGSGDDKRTVHYTGKEKVFELKMVLCGSSNSGSRMVLPAGQTNYPFMFQVPPNIPSSFEGLRGHIRYEMKAEIDRPWKFDHKVKRPITINDIIDTNQPQYSLQPGGTEHKDVGCLCCTAGPLEMKGHVDRSCYCPGEIIFITADIQNQTSRDMTGLKGKLIQTIIYMAEGDTKHEIHKVAMVEGAGIPKGGFAKWDNQALNIPALPPSIINSRVINVTYQVVIEVDVPWGLDPTINMPITMGTIPFRPAYQQINVPQIDPNTPQMGMAPPSNIFTDMAPPSYASVSGVQPISIGDESDHYTKGNLSYIPVYTFAQPYQGPPPNAPPPMQQPIGPPVINQQPGGYPIPPQDPGMYPPPPPQGQPGGYPPLQQGAPGNFPPPAEGQPGGSQQNPGYYPPPQQDGGYPLASPEAAPLPVIEG